MEVAATPPITNSKTLAGLARRAAEEHGERVAVRYKRGGTWHDVTFAEVDSIVHEVALGLIDLGIEQGERLSILAGTRPEWSYVDLAASTAGIVVVPIYQTNSPDECHWVMHDSGAVAIVCEDAAQLAKVQAVRDRLPNLRVAILIEPPSAGHGSETNGSSAGGAPGLPVVTLAELRERGRASESSAELDRRCDAVAPKDIFTIIYTSGTTGPPKGCVLTHANYRAMLDSVEQGRLLRVAGDDVVYLYLPLAHSFALLVQLVALDLGQTIAYFGGDTKQIVAELAEVRPTYLPSVPRVFEKIYTLV
ncbi:MAG: AMP-binding protein, partial [Solirubrobacteraceae bacterium]